MDNSLLLIDSLSIPIIRLHKVGKVLGLLVAVVVMVVVRVVGLSDIVHSVDTATLGAAFKRPLAGHLSG